MTALSLSSTVIESVARFMQTFLTERIPDGDFTEGSVNYDHLILGFSNIVAKLQSDQVKLRQQMSLLFLKNAEDTEETRQAADAILANLYRVRSGGQFAKGFVIIHFSSRTDFQLYRTTRFFKTQGLVYYINSPTDLFVPSDQLTPVRGMNGTITDYTYSVELVAERTGTEYNQQPGTFDDVDRFNPFIVSVENTVPIQTGTDVQTTADFIRKSKTALSVRALVNARSNDATLTDADKFPTVSEVLTIGAGDPEMVRDILRLTNESFTLSLGGHQDIFIKTPLQQVTESLVVGAEYVRPDNRILIFKDTSGTRNFLTGTGPGMIAPVIPGDVLVISGLPKSPFQYKIAKVNATQLEIVSQTPFSQATDEQSVLISLVVSIGNNYPGFNNKLGISTSNQFKTSRTMSKSGTVGLSGRPIYRVKKVEIFNASAALDAYKNPSTDTLLFTNRVNNTITQIPAPGDELPFRVTVINPLENQSSLAVTQVELGWPGQVFDGLTAEITYDTRLDFKIADQFVRSPAERITSANVLLRAKHPVYLAMTVPYALSITPDPLLGNTVVPFDEQIVAEKLSDFVSQYVLLNPLDQSILSTKIKSVAQTAASIYPFTIQYELYAPDGCVYKYETNDRINVFTDTRDNVRLLNPEEVGLPSTNYGTQLRNNLQLLGISNRTICYILPVDQISFERRSS